MLTAGLSELELRIIIIVCCVVGIIAIIVLLCYLYHRRSSKGSKGGFLSYFFNTLASALSFWKQLFDVKLDPLD